MSLCRLVNRNLHSWLTSLTPASGSEDSLLTTLLIYHKTSSSTKPWLRVSYLEWRENFVNQIWRQTKEIKIYMMAILKIMKKTNKNKRKQSKFRLHQLVRFYPKVYTHMQTTTTVKLVYLKKLPNTQNPERLKSYSFRVHLAQVKLKQLQGWLRCS